MGMLNLSGGGGSYIRFMPSVNAWVVGGEEIAVRQMILNLDSVKSGWGKMAEGQAPEWVWDSAPGKRASRPTLDHKPGFSTLLYIKNTGVVEWSSNGSGPVIGFDKIYTDCMGDAANNPGMYPVIEYSGSDPLKIGKGATRVPQFKLVKWVPADSVAWDDGDEDEAPTPAPKATPKPAPKAASNAAVDDEF